MASLFSGLLGSTPLHSAVKKCQLAEVQQLVQKGAQVDGKDKEGCTPLHVAAERGYAPIVTELLNRLATATICNNEGRTPVHEAARCGHVAVLALLLGPQNKRDAQHTKTALVNAADRTGQTPLMLAIQTHHLAVAQDLIRLGADPNKQDSAGNTSFMAAVRRGDIETMVALYTCGASLEHPRTHADGWSPLHVAAAVGQEAAARWLVERGASLETKDNQARTPLDVAQAHEQFSLVRYLRTAALQRGATPSSAAAAATVGPSPHVPTYLTAGYGAPSGDACGDASAAPYSQAAYPAAAPAHGTYATAAPAAKLPFYAGGASANLAKSKLQVLAESEAAYQAGAGRLQQGGPSGPSGLSGMGGPGGPGAVGGRISVSEGGAGAAASVQSLAQQWAEHQQRLAMQAGAPAAAAYPQLPPGATVYY